MSEPMPSGTLRENEVSLAQIGYIWFLRFLGVVCLFGALNYWGQLTGFFDIADNRRFDELSANARISYTALALVLPFAGLGLWFQSSWGIVLWVGCVLLQFCMYTLWDATFGQNPILLALIAAAALILAGYLIWLIIQRRNARLIGY